MIDGFNELNEAELRDELKRCCPNEKWIDAVVAGRPYLNDTSLLRHIEDAFHLIGDDEWIAVFRAAGDPEVMDVDGGTRSATLVALKLYHERFGYPFVVAAEQLGGEELLMRVRIRLGLEPNAQLRASRAEQRKIAQTRLRRLLEKTTA
jgi:2-oxo-4-hydroxy-4-carboxy-5-ureidoimidazoline decarboxylase